MTFPRRPAQSNDPAPLDATDLKIVEALRGDGRMTKLKLAQKVNLSPAACWERLARLERTGVILGYAAVVNVPAARPGVTVIVEISLKAHRRADFAAFERAVGAQPAIVACDATGGGVDYIMRVESEDMAAYQAIIDALLERVPAIERYYSYVVTKAVR